MAARVLNLRRLRGPAADPGDQTTYDSGRIVSKNTIVVRVDLDDDGRRVEEFHLAEADHPGLIAEFVAGASTTILEGAIEGAIAAHTDDEYLTSTQKSNVILKSVTWPPA